MLQSNTDREVLKNVVNDILLFLYNERQVSGWEYQLAIDSIGPRIARLSDEQAKRLRGIAKTRLTS